MLRKLLGKSKKTKEGEERDQKAEEQQQPQQQQQQQEEQQQGSAMAFITDGPPTTWTGEELAAGRANYSSDESYELSFSKQNPTPGTGRTGFIPVAPNNYPFYSSSDEVYTPVLQSDGGQLSEWQPMYQPSREQAEADRAAAYEAGVPHGYVAPGDRFKGLPTIQLQVVSELHDDSEYGSDVAADGSHSGGPFSITVSPKMRVEELRAVIRDVGGILPALQRLSYAGKHLDDAQRTLEQYGIGYWHNKFPHWPIRVRRF